MIDPAFALPALNGKGHNMQPVTERLTVAGVKRPTAKGSRTKNYACFGMMLALLTACSSPAQRAAEAQSQAQLLASSGQYAKAAERFAYAVRMRDDLPDLWVLRARNQVAMGDYAGAFASYQAALDLDATNIEALDAVAQLSIAANDLNRARKYSAALLTIDPANLTGQWVAATVAFRVGRLDDAQDIVDKLLASNPDDEPALVLRSRVLQSRGDLTGALAAILPIFSGGRGGPELLRQLTALYGQLADGNGLLSVAQRAAREQPKDGASQVNFAERLILVGRMSEGLRVLDGIHRAAPADLLRAQTVTMFADAGISPSDIIQGASTLPTIDRSLAMSIVRYALIRNDPGSVKVLMPVLRDRPLSRDTLDCYGIYALALSQINANDDALAAASKALALDAREPWSLMARANVNFARRKFPAALRDAQIAAADNPDLPEAIQLLARIFKGVGETLLSEKAITDGFNANLNHPVFFEAMTRLMMMNGRDQDAIDLARSFTMRNPASVLGWEVRRSVCQTKGQAECITRATSNLSRLHGGAAKLILAPPEEISAERDFRKSSKQ
jgi:tetratricopeptide (TPR) repeat protein